jgi:uncharacterized protein with HXXEE motif
MSLDVLLWTFLGTYVVHLVDETTMNGGFIRWFQASFWPTYTARMNFWFNAGAVGAITISNLLYDLAGGRWIILALIWPFGFAVHGITLHLYWTIRQRNLSPGLVTSLLYWIMAYFFVRYGYLAGRITPSDFWTGAILAVLTVGAFLTFVPTVVIPRVIRARSLTATG